MAALFVEFVAGKKIQPGKLIRNLKITYLKRKIIFQTFTIVFHVDCQRCVDGRGHRSFILFFVGGFFLGGYCLRAWEK